MNGSFNVRRTLLPLIGTITNGKQARAVQGELVVISVTPRSSRRQIQTTHEERQLRKSLQLARDLGAKVIHLRGDVSDQLVKYCRTHHVSMLIIAHPSHSLWNGIIHGSVTSELLHKMPEIDIFVVGNKHQELEDAP
jgi:K+-sensing histidine kinase KdpD